MVTTKMLRLFVIFISLVTSQAAFALTKVTATIDKNPVAIKESVVLTVIADDDVDSNALDTSALLKDFVVGRTSVSTQTSSINFKTTRTTKWTTLLMPKKTGKLVIPSLAVEGVKTDPIAVVVLAADNPKANQQKDLFITTDVSTKEVYVQQMLTLTVKLHFAAELKRGSLSEPSMQGASIAQVGNDVDSETIINGRRYRIIERTYSITPQESGEFNLASPLFSGEIMVQSARRPSFFSFGETKPISVMGDEITINVKPVPASYQGHWLPSEILTLHEEWQPTADTANGEVVEYEVGQPITRTINLTAAGVTVEQLPEINFNLPTGLKVYPDQVENHSGINTGRLISQSVRNFAIVATHAGEYQIPAIEVPWWNTVTNRKQVATLPALTIKVVPSTTATNQTASPAVSTPANVQTQAPIIIEKNSWLTWLFLGLWLVSLVGWLSTYLIMRNRKPADKSVKPAHQVTNLHLELLAACKQNNAKQVMALLLPWAKQLASNNGVTSKINTIADAKAIFANDDFSQAVDALYSQFYGSNSQSAAKGSWQGKTLMQAIVNINKSLQQPNKQGMKLNP